MNKAVCIRDHIALKAIGINVGDEVEYEKDPYRVYFNGHRIKCGDLFFIHFDVIEGDDKMNYSEFEHVLITEVFKTAVLFPNEYSGVRHMIIQDYGFTIMITISKDEHAIRVSYPDKQEVYSSYEEALNGIIESAKKCKG